MASNDRDLYVELTPCFNNFIYDYRRRAIESVDLHDKSIFIGTIYFEKTVVYRSIKLMAFKLENDFLSLPVPAS